MKKTNSVIALLLLAIGIVSGKDNLADALRYYPLNSGDQYNYIHHTNGNLLGSCYSMIKCIIGNDSLMTNGKKYKNALLGFERVDESTGNVYVYKNNSETNTDSLLIKTGGVFKSVRPSLNLQDYTNLKCYNEMLDSSWGIVGYSKVIQRDLVPTDGSTFSYSMMQDIGITEYEKGDPIQQGFYGSENYSLVSATIKGQKYYNKIYYKYNLSEFYMYKTGNVWLYKNTANNQIMRVEVKGDSIINGETFKILENRISGNTLTRDCVKYYPDHNSIFKYHYDYKTDHWDVGQNNPQYDSVHFMGINTISRTLSTGKVCHRFIGVTKDGSWILKYAKINGAVYGTITTNTIWSDSIKVNGDLTVDDGVRLTIQPGTIITFNGNYTITVKGSIQALGTATQNIKFIPAVADSFWQGINYPENSDSDSSTFTHCIFQQSKSSGNGGVFNVQKGNRIVVADCVAEDDKAANNGGFICANEADITIINSVIRRNSAGMAGGALYLENCTQTMINNTFNHNSAGQNGGAVVFNNTDGNIYNSIFWFNSAADNSQISLTDNGSDPNFYNNNLAGGFQGITGSGSGVNFSGIYLNNLNVDPMFSNDSSGYNLNSASPCINSGIQSREKLTLPTFDINGSPRIALGTVDIGASEYSSNAIDNQPLISGYALEQNYPNPFNPETVIAFTLPFSQSDKVALKICNVKGEMVKSLEYKNLAAGRHQVALNLADYPSGIYFYTVKTADYHCMKRMVLIK